MIYAQFQKLSTGYPTFTEQNRKPIDMCGSDSVVYLDGRKTIRNLIEDVIKVYEKHSNKNSIIKFQIYKGEINGVKRKLADFTINK